MAARKSTPAPSSSSVDPATRRRMLRATGELVDYALEQLNGDTPARKIEGAGWAAYVYQTHGPGSECIRLELRVGTGWAERIGGAS